METRTPPWRALVLPIGFTLLCVAATIIAYNVFGGTTPLTAKGYRVTVPLEETTNLVRGSDVQTSGVTIGEVVDIERAGNTAAATLELKSRFAPLRSRAVATARTKTLLGEGYVEIEPGAVRAAPIPDGGRLTADRVRPTVDLDEFISTFDSGTRGRMRQLFTGLATSLDGRSRALNDSLGSVAPFTDSLGRVLGAVRDQDPALGHLVANSATVLRAVGERSGAVQAAVDASNRVLATTAAQRRALGATVAALPPFLAQLRRTSNAVSDASPQLNRAVAGLLPSAPLVVPALQEINAATPEFRTLFRQLPGTLADGRRAMPPLSRTIRSARHGFRDFYPTSRELIPFMQLFAESKNIINLLANLGSAFGSYVGPDGTVLGFGTALPTVWNETVAGWTRKLPTNRQNPYPKPPDALLDYGKIGTLKAYDCRHTGNPPLLPATGTGAPPCIEQGPWTFNGKRAYYPRLELARP